MRRELDQTMTAFRENLENMPISLRHDLEYGMDIVVRDFLMEEVAHAVDEDALRPAPAERKRHLVGLKCHRKTIPVAGIAHRLKTESQALSVAVLATRADLGTTRHRIPRGIGPLNAGLITQSGQLLAPEN